MSTDYASYGADPEVPEQSPAASAEGELAGVAEAEVEEEEEEENDDLDFDLVTAAIPSFQALHQARASVFRNTRTLEAFKRVVATLSAAGDEGRRKGLGLWMQGEWQAAAEQLAKYDDVVANFTRANALMAAERYKDALPIFEKLTNAYPEEPKPRGGMLEAKLELDFVVGDTDKTIANLRAGLEKAPKSFATSAEGHYLLGRLAELERKWELAIDEHEAAREVDQTHRGALFRSGYLCERYGLEAEALEAYRMLTTLRPIDMRSLINLGLLYEDLGRDNQAAACYETVRKNTPADRKIRLFVEDARQGMSMYYDEDLERKEDRLNQILRTPITDFELSVRARNCLNKMNILTLGDLVRRTEQELLSYKNFGETSLNEIKQILGSKNLRLGMAHHEAVASIEAAVRPMATGENADMLNKPISELDLSIRARRAVENLGCLTVGDVAHHAEEELLSMPNFGQTSLAELKRKLSELGLSLAEKKKE
jgi:DNA-directed RNA polymerase subunit alpha